MASESKENKTTIGLTGDSTNIRGDKKVANDQIVAERE